MNSPKEKLGEIPFTIAPKNIYLGINLTKDAKDLHLENYKIPKKELKEDTNKWKHMPLSWPRRINIIKMFMLSKAIYRFNPMSITIPMAYFPEQEHIFQNFL